MFELYAIENYSLARLQDEITKMGARTKKGKKFAISKLNKILTKPFYCGIMDTKYGVVEHKYEWLTTPAIFQKVQAVVKGCQSKPHKTKAKPFILKGMITCANCGCVVAPKIKKERYVYYSCTNGKKACKRVYVPEKKLIAPLLEYFDHIALSDEQIETITQHLKEIYQSESKFHSDSLKTLRKEQDKLQRRVGQIYDDKLDGLIDETMYLEKVREYKGRQTEILEEMKRHEVTGQNFYVTANMVLKLAARARELYESSEVDEKRQLLNYVFQNLRLDKKTLLLEICEPFKAMAGYKQCSTHWRWLDAFRTFDWASITHRQSPFIATAFKLQ